MKEKTKSSLTFDKAYKWLLEYCLKDAIALIHPKLFKKIDWNIPRIYHEQELANLALNNDKLYSKVDKLIEFTLLNKKRICILLHVEIQLTKPKEIAERMFYYKIHLILKYPKKQVQSLLVYIGNEQIKNMNKYKFKTDSDRIFFDFTTFNLAEHSKEFLIEQNNVVAILLYYTKLIQAGNKTQLEIYKSTKETLQLLEKLDKDLEIFKKFRNFVLKLIPTTAYQTIENLFKKNKKLKKYMTHIDTEEKANAVINSVNRLWEEGKTIDDFISQGWQVGRQEGRQEGENIGLNKGRQEGQEEGQITNLTNNILKMNLKGFSAQEISNILDVEIDFVNNIIAKNKT